MGGGGGGEVGQRGSKCDVNWKSVRSCCEKVRRQGDFGDSHSLVHQLVPHGILHQHKPERNRYDDGDGSSDPSCNDLKPCGFFVVCA